MAPMQPCGSAEAFECRYNNVVTDMSHKADNVVSQHRHAYQHGAVTGGLIQNNAGRVKFLNKHDWSGQNKTPYPRYIAQCYVGKFVHAASFHGPDDEGAVVYTDECGSAYLLAWSVKGNCGCGTTNKVYVETGPVLNYIAVNWCDIKANLDASCDRSYAMDRYGSEIYAKISHGRRAALAATLNRCCVNSE